MKLTVTNLGKEYRRDFWRLREFSLEIKPGDIVGFPAWTSAAVFIPSLVLAFGVSSNSRKLFEILYMCMWYIGPLNKVPPPDYPGANGDGNIHFFLPVSIALIVAALIGREGQGSCRIESDPIVMLIDSVNG